jgi:hypothetical protein
MLCALLGFACDDDRRQPPAADTNADGGADDGDADDGGADDGGADDGGEVDDGGDDDGGGGDDGGGAEFGFCVHACADAADCCFEGVECGTYPNAWECDGGACVPLGCASDDDCVYIQGTTCEMAGGIGQCVMLCEEDADCIVDLGETCSGRTDDDAGFCVIPAPQCGSNEECNSDDSTSFVCTDGQCLCDEDDDCASIGGTCDGDTGLCHCTGNASCPDGFACA